MLTQARERERRREKLEGVYLTPAHPGVKAWLGSIAREIAERYDVDGIHLDYIRQPDASVGYDPTTRARFAIETGVDPGRFRDLPRSMRAAVDSAWHQFQRDQVTQTVRQVRDSVHSVRPGLELSAAVVADTARAERWDAQSWRQWLREGLLDRAFLMCYAPSVQQVMDQLLAFEREFGATDRLVPGIAIFNTSPTTAALKIKGARALGYPLLALYSYDSLFLNPISWVQLRGQLETAGRDSGYMEELL